MHWRSRCFATGGAGGMRRTRSAEPRRENRKAYRLSRYGHVEPIFLTVEIRFVSGRLLKELTVKDYSGTGFLLETTSILLCMSKDRFRLYYQCDNIADKRRTMFQLLKGKRFAQITCVVLPPENCTECGAAAVPSGWTNLLTGLPEYHKKCDCWCSDFEEWGWRTKRLWTQMVVAWHRSRIESLYTDRGTRVLVIDANGVIH